MAIPMASMFYSSPSPCNDYTKEEQRTYRRVRTKIMNVFRTGSQDKALNATHNGGDQFTANTKFKPPPTYDDSMKEVERVIEEAAKDPLFQQQIKETSPKTAGSQDMKGIQEHVEESTANINKVLDMKAIHEHVENFTANITKINKVFEDIRAKLHAVDQRGLKDHKGKAWKGERRWIGLRDKWSSLLEESQDTARKSIIRCDDILLFCKGVLEIKSVDDPLYKDTITELKNFIKTPDPAGKIYNPEGVKKRAMEHSKAFRDLKDKLTNFMSDFDSFVRHQGTHIDHDIADLNEKIQVIEREIAFDVGKIMSLGVALNVTGFATLAGGVIAAVLGPLNIGEIITLVLGALGDECALVYYTKDQSKKEEQHDKCQGELSNKKAVKEFLEDVKSQLEDPNDGLGFIISLVDLLRNVWHMIAHEAGLMALKLEAATNKPTLTYVQANIKEAKGAYEKLRDVLDKYGRAI